MKVVRKGGEELGLVGGVEIHYIYTVYNFGPYLGLFLSILSAVDLKTFSFFYVSSGCINIYMFTCSQDILNLKERGHIW